MSTRWLIAFVSVVVLLAGACESPQDEESAGTDSDDTEVSDDEEDAQQRLADAVAATFEQETAEFTATSQNVTGADATTGTDDGQADGTTDDDGASDDNGASDDDGVSDDNGASDDDGASEDNGASDDNGVSDDNGASDDNGVSEDDSAADDDASAAATGDDGADGTEQIEIDGAIDFGQDLREINLAPSGSTQGPDVSGILDQDDLYVQLADAAPSSDDGATDEEATDEEATDEEGTDDENADDESAEAQWARVSVEELVDVESQASQALLHDPHPMLQALDGNTVDVREGGSAGATDGGGEDTTSDDDSASEDDDTAGEDDAMDNGMTGQPDLIATIDLAESEQPVLNALSEQTGSDELDVEVWLESATGDNGDTEDTDDGNGEDERIQQLAINVPDSAAGGDTTDDTDTGGDTTDDTDTGGETTDDTDTGDDTDAGDDGDADDNGMNAEDGTSGETGAEAPATGEDWELMIELTDFGSEVNIEAPEDDEVVEIDVDELRAMFSGQREGVEPTPTPDADDDDTNSES